MRIAFVGKGGSGKTTLSSLFSLYLHSIQKKPVCVIDADLNMHMADQLGLADKIGEIKNLSDSDAQDDIKKYLIGNNTRIKSTGHFKKTTPPARGSSLIDLSDTQNYLYKKYSLKRGNIYLSVVGTYVAEKIGRSCYHDSLAILENILSHSKDENAYLVTDMVAGIDSFANTLHSQFDLLIFCVEPTLRSIEVYQQYEKLAYEAGVDTNVYVIVNKAKDATDLEFVAQYIDQNKIIGMITESRHIRMVERGTEELDIERLEHENKIVLQKIHALLHKIRVDPNLRLKKLHTLHTKYVDQGYIKDRFGDLSNQIDTEFSFIKST